ncbi:MAG: DUF2779 domain-containing protein [Metamycoplasmataceae bacterium]
MKIYKITFNIFYKSLICQKYFIWNKPESLKIDDYDEEIEEMNNFWEIEDNEETELEKIEVTKKGFEIVENAFNNFIIQNAKKENLNIYINSEKNEELAIKKTNEAINDEKIDIVLYPVFQLENAVAKPTIYNKKLKKISNFNYNTGTKLKDYLKAFYDYEIIKKNGIEIEDYSIYTIEIKKNGIDKITFSETFYCNSTKNKRKPKEEFKKNIASKQEAFLGDPKKEKNTIFQKISSGIITKDISLNSINHYIHYINNAKDAKLENHLDDDITVFGSNPFFNDLVKCIYPKNLPLSGKLINKKKTKELSGEYEKLLDYYNDKIVINSINRQENKIDKELALNIIEEIELNNTVWYDFEGFSLPFSILENTFPYQQIVFQVSVIKSEKNLKLDKSNNIVIDTKNIKYEDFFKIIDAIYWDKAKYVVYNKNYENTRLKEMLTFLLPVCIDKKMMTEYNVYEEKVKHIIDNTIDLLDLFAINSGNAFPPIFLWELNGFSSIKKIEKYINEKNIELSYKITPYKDLKIQNGLMAMEKGISRFLGDIGNREWETISFDLKKYCENDVKAMIMVYFFAKKLIDES